MTVQECLADTLSVAQACGVNTVPVCQSLFDKGSPPVSLPSAMSAEPSATAACTSAEALLRKASVWTVGPKNVYCAVTFPRGSPASPAANNYMQDISIAENRAYAGKVAM